MDVTPDGVAQAILESVPLMMRTVRAEMRRHRAAGLSVPQFRTLAFLRRHRGASLSEAAGHLGLTPPATSKLIDGLLARGLLSRAASAQDRRRITLALTPKGRSVLRIARRGTQVALAARLSALPRPERAQVIMALGMLRQIFEAGEEAPRAAAWRS